MLTAKEAKMIIERLLIVKPEIEVLFYLYDHYKVLGLPSGKKFTEKQISEALDARILPWICKVSGLPSNLTLEEIRERLQHMDKEACLQQLMEKGNEVDESVYFGTLVVSYYVLTDPERRRKFENWVLLAKWFERLKIIKREKEEMEENDLMSLDDLLWVMKLRPWLIGACVIALPVTVPANICWLIGRSSCRAIIRHFGTGSSNDDKKAACEGSSGLEDIQDWELVNEDDFVA